MTAEEGKLEQMLWDIERDNVSGSVRMARKTAILVREAAVDADASGEEFKMLEITYTRAAAKRKS